MGCPRPLNHWTIPGPDRELKSGRHRRPRRDVSWRCGGGTGRTSGTLIGCAMTAACCWRTLSGDRREVRDGRFSGSTSSPIRLLRGARLGRSRSLQAPGRHPRRYARSNRCSLRPAAREYAMTRPDAARATLERPRQAQAASGPSRWRSSTTAAHAGHAVRAMGAAPQRQASAASSPACPRSKASAVYAALRAETANHALRSRRCPTKH